MAMSSPSSSFNSHSNCRLHVTATQIKDSSKEPLEPLVDLSVVNLNIIVSTTFCSDNPWNAKIFERVTMVGKQALMSSTIDSPARCREVIRNVIADTGVPMELGDCTWRHKFLDGEEVYEMPGVEDFDRLIENIGWFLYEVKTRPHNQGFTFLPVKLAIAKKVVVPDAAFEAWCSWYEEMEVIDPYFAA